MGLNFSQGVKNKYTDSCCMCKLAKEILKELRKGNR